MTTGDTLLPNPDVAASAVVELATAIQPRGVDAGLDLLKSIGIYSGTLKESQERPDMVAIETTGPWRTTDSGLFLGADGAVVDFWSMMWFRGPSENLPAAFQTLVEAVSDAIGSPDEATQRSNGSQSAYWLRPTGNIEFHYYVEEPRARDGVQVSIGWTHNPEPNL